MANSSLNRKSPAIFAVASVAMPFLAVGATYLYQYIAYNEWWKNSQRQEAVFAGTLAAAELIQYALALGIGLLLGSILGTLSIILNRKLVSLGLLALGFNLIPFLLLVAAWIVQFLKTR